MGRDKRPTWALVEINVDDAADDDDGGLLFSEVAEAAAVFQSASGDGVPAGGLGSSSTDADGLIDWIAVPTAHDVDREVLAGASNVGCISDSDVAQIAALGQNLATLELDGWRYLVTSDAIRGEAQAAVDAFLVEEGVFETGEFVPEPVRRLPRSTASHGSSIDEDDSWFEEQAKRVGPLPPGDVPESLIHGQELIVVQVQRRPLPSAHVARPGRLLWQPLDSVGFVGERGDGT